MYDKEMQDGEVTAGKRRCLPVSVAGVTPRGHLASGHARTTGPEPPTAWPDLIRECQAKCPAESAPISRISGLDLAHSDRPRGGRVAKALESKKVGGTAANVGYEAELWKMADALRGSMDAAEYKHVVWA